MIWCGIRYHLSGGMTPLAGTPSPSMGYPMGLLVWLCIKRPAEGAIM